MPLRPVAEPCLRTGPKRRGRSPVAGDLPLSLLRCAMRLSLVPGYPLCGARSLCAALPEAVERSYRRSLLPNADVRSPEQAARHGRCAVVGVVGRRDGSAPASVPGVTPVVDEVEREGVASVAVVGDVEVARHGGGIGIYVAFRVEVADVDGSTQSAVAAHHAAKIFARCGVVVVRCGVGARSDAAVEAALPGYQVDEQAVGTRRGQDGDGPVSTAGAVVVPVEGGFGRCPIEVERVVAREGGDGVARLAGRVGQSDGARVAGRYVAPFGGDQVARHRVAVASARDGHASRGDESRLDVVAVLEVEGIASVGNSVVARTRLRLWSLSLASAVKVSWPAWSQSKSCIHSSADVAERRPPCTGFTIS